MTTSPAEVTHSRSPLAGLWPPTVPMALTLSRIALVPVFLALVILGRRWPALGLFTVMAVTDRLDGSLARRWGQTTRLGTLLDPVADKLLVTASTVLLAFDRFAGAGFAIPWAVPLGIFLKDLGVLIGIAVVVKLNGRVDLHASRPGKESTTIQLILVIATLVAPDLARLSLTGTVVLLWGLWWATVWAAAAAGVDYGREGARQLRRPRPTAPGFPVLTSTSSSPPETRPDRRPPPDQG